ncbi:MAG: stage sporulation protein [Acidobacteriota bacterium]|jgi:stage V sporulation protein G|nr:stage sporulation protein [Acidobacteriota bacterium]
MEITEVKVFPIQEEKLKAFVSIVFDQCFMVNDIKIIQGRDGLFISMPSRKKKNGEFKDVAHPLNNETRRMIEDKVLGEYHRVLEERGEEPMAMPAMPAIAATSAMPAIPGLGDEGEERMPLAAAPPPPSEKSMEEVQEMHLRDSFWTVP